MNLQEFNLLRQILTTLERIERLLAVNAERATNETKAVASTRKAKRRARTEATS